MWSLRRLVRMGRPGVAGAGAVRPVLLIAYRRTRYEALGIDVRIGRRCAAMDRLLASHGAREGVFITAWNPFSRVMPCGWNRRMQARLAQALRRRCVLPASGGWGRWSEAHLFVVGDVRPVGRLGRLFRQTAVVVVRRGQAARLRVVFQGAGSKPLA
jgi:hypothetical protein